MQTKTTITVAVGFAGLLGLLVVAACKEPKQTNASKPFTVEEARQAEALMKAELRLGEANLKAIDGCLKSADPIVCMAFVDRHFKRKTAKLAWHSCRFDAKHHKLGSREAYLLCGPSPSKQSGDALAESE